MTTRTRQGALRLVTWLKLLFILLFFLGAGAMLAAGFLPSTWSVERSIAIQAPPERIFPMVAELRRWPEWTVWTEKQDATLQTSYSGPPRGPGAGSRWQGETLGKGAMTVTAWEPDSRLDYSLSLQSGTFDCQGTMRLEPMDGGTRVTWTIRGDVGGNLPARLFIRSMESHMAPDLEAGLRQLKALVETK